MTELELYNNAINAYGIDAQKWMLIEECGELLDAFAKLKRGRSSEEDIISELADVHIMIEQMAVFFGYSTFLWEKQRKLNRLQERLSKKGGQS